MEIDLALLADAATVDGSGKLNILGVFDRLNAAQFPAQHGRIALVLRFQAGLDDAGKHKVEINLVDPSGEKVIGVSGDIHIGPGRDAAEGGFHVPQVLNLDGIVFVTGGRYSFDVIIDDVHHASIPLRVSGPPPGPMAMA